LRPTRPSGSITVVLSATRNEREQGPRFAFRLNVAPGVSVKGRLDRWEVYIVCDNEADFPEPERGEFVEFLRSLRLGEVRVER
jgi:hypothetical protein